MQQRVNTDTRTISHLSFMRATTLLNFSLFSHHSLLDSAMSACSRSEFLKLFSYFLPPSFFFFWFPCIFLSVGSFVAPFFVLVSPYSSAVVPGIPNFPDFPTPSAGGGLASFSSFSSPNFFSDPAWGDHLQFLPVHPGHHSETAGGRL